MKQKKIVLKEGMNQLLDSELKALKGGSKVMYTYCHCYGLTEGLEATGCDQCEKLCKNAGGVQNCNYVIA
ncbi:MAG: hypothetical protein IKW32_08645 [Bacteroidaceae bacterium]|nr:hypothetical protein [Bacteroidaceae bacterium]